MQGQQEYQPKLFTVFNMEELIPKRHLLREIDKVIDFGFVREATADLYCQDNGRPSIDPELFVRICLLMHLYNIPSDRQVCEEVQYNLAYRWFCRLSLEDSVPDHSSLTRIRDRLGEKTFKEIFEHIIRLCIEKGIVKGDKVMMDGSYIKADAALSSMVAKVGNLDMKDNTPKKNIKGRKFSNETHVSKTDPDSALAGKQGQAKQLRYKLHETIDRESRIILDAHITPGSEVDGKQMIGRLDHVEETFSINIEEMTGDRGYGYGVNLQELEDRGIKSFVPNFHRDVGGHLEEQGFRYDEEKDIVTCPVGIEMKFSSMSGSNGENESSRVYTIKKNQCESCPRLAQCLPKSSESKLKTFRKKITVNVFYKVQKKTRLRERTKEFRLLRGERQWKMEGIFAEAKNNHGLGRARYRGRAKMQIQAYMIASVQNLKRLAGHLPAVAVAFQLRAVKTIKNIPSIFFDGIIGINFRDFLIQF
jgi:transposase